MHEQTTQPEPGQHAGLGYRPNQTVYLQAESPLHRGTYRTTVLEFRDGQLRITLPEENGKLVFIPVGTTVMVGPGDGTFPARWRVIDREAGETRCLVLGLPQTPATAAPPGPKKRVLAISSGKGGVGKTVLAINLALALQKRGQRVGLLDADLGTANIDVLLNLTPRYTLANLLRGESTLPDTLVKGPEGLLILPGGSAVPELADLDEARFRSLYAQLAHLDAQVDLILIDTGAGLSRRVTSFLLAAQEIILVTTPEPHAITDAYALVKVISAHRPHPAFHLVVAMAASREEAERVARKMAFACGRFLNVDLPFLGPLRADAAVPRSVRRQIPLLEAFPHSPASRDIDDLATRLLGLPPEAEPVGGLRGFLRRLRTVAPPGSDTER